ncbi:MAG TPA: hypothetical protein VK211_06550 [Kamptonema sp.]|nr:hypothetical protein [Kamptonema sp.]
MVLFFPNGDTFATGASPYEYRPATESETTNRIVLSVEIEGRLTEAVVDTGAPYVIWSPRLARLAGFTPADTFERTIMLVRGMRLEGGFIRVTIKLLGKEGDSLYVDATAFMPDIEEYWGNFPSFLGLTGFLERIRFVADPNTDTFYFGPL